MSTTNKSIPPPSGGSPAGQVIAPADYQRLWRIADAVSLLAKIPSEAAKTLGIEANHTSAVAEYIREDLTAILTRSTPADD